MFATVKSFFSPAIQSKSECDNVISTDLYGLINEFRNKLKYKSSLGPANKLMVDYIDDKINNKSTYKDIENLFVELYIYEEGLINFFYFDEIDNDIIELIQRIYEYAFKKCNKSDSHHYKTLTEIQQKFNENITNLFVNQTPNPSKPTPTPNPTPSIQQLSPKSPINTNPNPKDRCDINKYKPLGLQNCGNTCYMNSVIQALLGIKKFREKVFNLIINLNSNKDISYYTDIIKYEKFEKLNLEKNKETFQIKLLNFLNDIICKNPIIEFENIVESIIKKVNLLKGTQNDADEFIYKLINGTTKLINEISLLPKDIMDLFKYESSFKIFNNNNKEISNSKTNSKDKNYEFKLPIEGNRKIMDIVNDNRSQDISNYNFSNKKIDVIKKTYFESYPEILFVTIPLFTNDGYKYTKNNRTNITFDNYNNITIGPNKYQLVSFICRTVSSFNSGHYWAYVKVNTKWYRCDDNSVNEVPENEIKENFNKNCTVCFYEKE